MKRTYLLLLIAALVTPAFAAAIATPVQQTGKKEYTFRGKVEAVDTKAKTLEVNGETVVGWMGAMKMTYSVDKEDVLKTLKVGDQITAKVYDGDFKVLHDVQVVTAKPAPPPAK